MGWKSFLLFLGKHCLWTKNEGPTYNSDEKNKGENCTSKSTFWQNTILKLNFGTIGDVIRVSKDIKDGANIAVNHF